MIEVSQFKRGLALQYKGQPMVIVDFTVSTPTARGGTPIARTRLRNLLTGQLLSESFRSSERFEEVDLERRPVAYLYSDGSRWHFMDAESYEQFELGADELGDAAGFLKDGQEGLTALVIDGRVVGVDLPNTVDLRVAEADPAIKGATATAQQKRAVLETGVEIQVPPYVETGDLVRVDTRDGHFVQRLRG